MVKDDQYQFRNSNIGSSHKLMKTYRISVQKLLKIGSKFVWPRKPISSRNSFEIVIENLIKSLQNWKQDLNRLGE